MAQYGGGPKTGGQMRLYYDPTAAPSQKTNAAAALAVMVENVCAITDLSIDDTRNTADLRYRCADVGFGLPAKRNPITATFRMVFGIDDVFWNLLKGDYAGSIIRYYWFASGDIAVSGTTGLTMPMFCSAYPHDQPLEDVAGHDIVLTYGYMEDAGSPQPPEWQTV